MVAPKNQAKDGKGRAVASPTDKLQASDDTSKQADQFEEEIVELKVKYDQYFLGLERFEPIKERDALKARLVKFKSVFIRNTGVRFRVQAQYQKFLSYERMWMRIAREIEEGTYSRDLFKAKLRGEKRKKSADKKKKGEAIDLSAEERELADAPEPKTDPHLSIPPELLEQPALVMPKPVAADGHPLIVPSAVRPPPAPQGLGAKSGPLPAVEPGRPGLRAPPPPPPQDAQASPRAPSNPGSKAPASPPPPLVPASRVSGPQAAVAAPSSRVSGPQVAVAAPSARSSGAQPAVVPGASRSTGPLPAVTSARAASSPPIPAKSPPPPPPGAARPPPPPAASSGARPPPPPSGAPGIGEEKMKAIVSAYVAAKRQCRESTEGLTYEAVSKSINSQIPDLMKQHNAKSVDFKVVIKNGKATLKAVPKV